MIRDLVSIVMPAYNTAGYIGDSICSVLKQTYENWELLIVDDCSTDDTEEVIRAFQDPRIRYIKNEKNSGAAVSRNRALREARGEWIAFLDSDDLWAPEKLEKQLAFMKETGNVFVYTDFCIIGEDGLMKPNVYIAPRRVNRCLMHCYCYFFTSTVIYHRETIGLIQIADVKKNNDYAMWLEVVKKADAYRLPECLSCYRRRAASISSGSKLRLIKHHYILFRKAQQRGPVPSLLLTGLNLICGVLKKIIYKRPMLSEEKTALKSWCFP